MGSVGGPCLYACRPQQPSSYASNVTRGVRVIRHAERKSISAALRNMRGQDVGGNGGRALLHHSGPCLSTVYPPLAFKTLRRITFLNNNLPDSSNHLGGLRTRLMNSTDM